ncbi:uncharacterized protein [Amphiura filiformis]|uniref:uncharacterized protein n=1 Tax=Amphiura filiformis TaxID=82378 RepID=UPI003B21569C
MLANAAVIDMYNTSMAGVRGYHSTVLKHVKVNGMSITPPPIVSVNSHNIPSFQKAILDAYKQNENPENPYHVLRQPETRDYSLLHDATTKYVKNVNSAFVRVVDVDCQVKRVPFSLTEVPGGSLNAEVLKNMLLEEIVGASVKPQQPHVSAYTKVVQELEKVKAKQVSNRSEEYVKKSVSAETELTYLQQQIDLAINQKEFNILAQLSKRADILQSEFQNEPTGEVEPDPELDNIQVKIPDYSSTENQNAPPFLLVKENVMLDQPTLQLPEILPRPPKFLKMCKLTGMNESTINVQCSHWANAISQDGCATNFAATRKLTQEYGILTPSSRCTSHTADGTLKRLAKSRTMNVLEVTTLYESLRVVMSHIAYSPKTTSLLKQSIKMLDMRQITTFNWCSTRMGGFFKACERCCELIVPLFDALVTGDVKEDQRAVLMSPTSTYLIFLLADISKQAFQSYLHTVDSDSVVISEVHGIAMRTANGCDSITTPQADGMLEQLEMDIHGNLYLTVIVKNQEHKLRLNYQHRGRRGGNEGDAALQLIKAQLSDLKRRVLQNIEENIKDQTKDTLASSFAALDLDSTESLETRLDLVAALWDTYGRDYTHTIPEKYCDMNITVTYKKKISCSLSDLQEEFRRAYPELNKLARKRKDAVEAKSAIPTQLSLLQDFVKTNEMSYYHVCQLVRIAISIAPNTGWIERSYSHLTHICEKHRGQLDMKNMETLYLLKELNIPVKENYNDELKLLQRT